MQHSISTKVVTMRRILHIKDNIVCCGWVGWKRSFLLGFQTITVFQNFLGRESLSTEGVKQGLEQICIQKASFSRHDHNMSLNFRKCRVGHSCQESGEDAPIIKKVSFPDQLTPNGGGEWDPTSRGMYPYDDESRSYPSRFVWSGSLSTAGRRSSGEESWNDAFKSLISRLLHPQILAKSV